MQVLNLDSAAKTHTIEQTYIYSIGKALISGIKYRNKGFYA
jgi:hypothetical protein